MKKKVGKVREICQSEKCGKPWILVTQLFKNRAKNLKPD